MALDTNTWITNHQEIDDAVKSLYWFNLGFALDGRIEKWNIWENVKAMQGDVANLLAWKKIAEESLKVETDWERIANIKSEVREVVETLVDAEMLSTKAQKYESYRQSVLTRKTWSTVL